MTEWLTLASTCILVGVTAWYAVLTRSLARSARDSAQSAQAAAEYAAQSVAAAVANVNVEFGCSPSYSIGHSDTELGVMLSSEGATVFVHGVFLIDAHECTEHGKKSAAFATIVYDPDGYKLDSETALPARLHKGESLAFETNPAVALDRDVSVAMMNIRVLYSLTGEGNPIAREVEWIGKYGRDFSVRDSK